MLMGGARVLIGRVELLRCLIGELQDMVRLISLEIID